MGHDVQIRILLDGCIEYRAFCFKKNKYEHLIATPNTPKKVVNTWLSSIGIHVYKRAV